MFYYYLASKVSIAFTTQLSDFGLEKIKQEILDIMQFLF